MILVEFFNLGAEVLVSREEEVDFGVSKEVEDFVAAFVVDVVDDVVDDVSFGVVVLDDLRPPPPELNF